MNAVTEAIRSSRRSSTSITYAVNSPLQLPIGGDRELAVRPDRDVPPAVPERTRAQEGLDRVVPAVPGRQRRHRPRGVLGQQLHQRVHVRVLQRARVALDQRALAVLAERLERLGLRARREPFLDDRARPLQRRVHRRPRGVHGVGDLLRREPEHVEHEQRRALVGRQVLDRRDERQLHRLGARRLLVREVRERLEPQQLVVGTLVGRGRLGRGGDIHGQDPSLLAVELVQARVRRDPVQPRAQRRATLEALAPAPARRLTSCSTSSASCAEPSIR